MIKKGILFVLLLVLNACIKDSYKKNYPIQEQDQKNQLLNDSSPADFEQSILQINAAKEPSSLRISKKNRPSKQQNNKIASYEYLKLQEAKLTDIPIPLDALLIDIHYDDETEKAPNNYKIQYESFLSLDALKQFYIQQMEFLGWKRVAVFNHDELLLTFKKPTLLCIISLRNASATRKNCIHIVVGTT